MSTTFEWLKFKYVILPGALTHDNELRGYYNLAYSFYKKIWERIFNRLDGQGSFNPEAFYQCTQVATIFYADTVVNQICCRELHLDNLITNDIRYFKDFQNKAAEDLNRTGTKKILTLEANALNSPFSKRKTNFPFTEVSMQLAVMLAASLGMECCTGTPRLLTGVHTSAEKLGFKTFEKGWVSHNCPVDIMLCYVNDLIVDQQNEVSQFIEYLWSNRVDYRSTFKIKNQPLNMKQKGAKAA